MRVAYVRVSSVDQNEQRQIEALKEYSIDKWFIEKVSAKDTNRPKLQEMLNYVRGGSEDANIEPDTIYILSFDRLARSTKDLLSIVELLDKKSVRLVSLKESIDTSTPMGKFFIVVISAISELERSTLLERQREGIKIAKEAGKYKGSNTKSIKDFPTHYTRYMTREVSKLQLAKQLKISRPTLDRMIKEYEEKNIHSTKSNC
jgi:DNA invertase Pin-like site-specific DNA recombinase